MAYRISARVWLYPGNAAWHFITVPKKESDAIKKKYGAKSEGGARFLSALRSEKPVSRPRYSPMARLARICCLSRPPCGGLKAYSRARSPMCRLPWRP